MRRKVLKRNMKFRRSIYIHKQLKELVFGSVGLAIIARSRVKNLRRLLAKNQFFKLFVYIIVTALCLQSCNSDSDESIGYHMSDENRMFIASRNLSFLGLVSENNFLSQLGFALDDQDRKVIEKSSPRTADRMDRNEPLTLNDVIKLSEGGINDDVIIQYIKDTSSVYNLSQTQVKRLQSSGVSQRVINAMIDSRK